MQITDKSGPIPPINQQQNPIQDQAKSVLSAISHIMSVMQPRLNAYKDARSAFAAGNQNVFNAVIFDNAPLHPISALDPCPTVNLQLSELVGSICLRRYDQEVIDQVLAGLSPPKLQAIQDLSSMSEESLEKSALDLIFAMQQSTDFKTLEHNIAKTAAQLMCDSGETPLQLAKFKALVFDTARQMQQDNPTLIGKPFIYFNNYVAIVEAELQLLIKPLPNHDALIDQDRLSEQRFAFVGAGFPLTAIVLHIKTGAKITLVDIDERAVFNGQKLIHLCERLGIIDPNAMSIIHANAVDCHFYQHTQEHQHTQTPTTQDKIPVPVTVLDLASALPVDITAKVIESAQGSLVIRKRNVDGLPQILYPKYTHSQDSQFTLAGKVIPPYYVGSNDPFVIGNAGAINVNSCQAFVPK